MRWFLLVGGFGSRLFPFSTVIPKCLLPIAGKPCVRWIVEHLMAHGHNDIVLCANRSSEAEFRYEFRDLPNVRFSVTEEPQGTVGELLNAKPLIDGPFGLQYGDDLTEIDYNALLAFHKAMGAQVTIATTTMYRLPVGIVEADDDGAVKSFSEKPYLGKLSWTSTAVFELETLPYFKAGDDISFNVLPALLADHKRIFAFRVNSPWFDVGDISAWARANQHYREKIGKQ